MEIERVLLRKNLPHVVTAFGKGQFEELDNNGPINPIHVIQGMAELNKNGISLLNISVGISKEGITKIDKSVIENGAIAPNEPTMSDILPEGKNVIQFKSDSWALGEFLVRNVYHPESKSIPKKFMKSQVLMNKFIDSLGPDLEVLKKLLVLDPHTREFTWNVLKKEETFGCIIQ